MSFEWSPGYRGEDRRRDLRRASPIICAGDYRVFVTPAPSEAQNIELAEGWQITSASGAGRGKEMSVTGFDTSTWLPVHRMPATVLQILQEDGVYPNLYYGKNLLNNVPQDLYKQGLVVSHHVHRAGRIADLSARLLRNQLPRDIWLNGHRVADNRRIVGMYNDHELDVSPWIDPGKAQHPGREGHPGAGHSGWDGVELADSWYDWINWRYLGYQGPGKNPANGNSFVPDRNAGIWKPVYLKTSGPVSVGPATVNTELPLPNTDSARLTIYSTLRNNLPSSRFGACFAPRSP